MIERYDHDFRMRSPGGVFSFVEDVERLGPRALQEPGSMPAPLRELQRLRREGEMLDAHFVVWLGSVYRDYFMRLSRPSEDPTFQRERSARRAMLLGLERTQLPVLVTLLAEGALDERSWLNAFTPSSWHYLQIQPAPPGIPALLLPDFDIDAVVEPEWRFITYSSAVRRSELWDLSEVFSLAHLPELIVVT